MEKCHDDPKLNSLLGKNISVTFWNGTQLAGKLERDPDGRYRINNCSFYKTHIKRIEARL